MVTSPDNVSTFAPGVRFSVLPVPSEYTLIIISDSAMRGYKRSRWNVQA